MKEYTIQISEKVTVSRTVKAENIESALVLAKEFVDATGDFAIVKPCKGWTGEWNDSREIVGVIG